MTPEEHQAYLERESDLAQKLSEKISQVVADFQRANHCQCEPVFYFGATLNQPLSVTGYGYRCFADERLEQIKRESNPRIITPNGTPKFVN